MVLKTFAMIGDQAGPHTYAGEYFYFIGVL